MIIGPNDADPSEAGKLMHGFQIYELLQRPQLGSGHTFSLEADAPRYRITTEECETYPPGDSFHNPYGMWRLTRVVR